MGEIEGRYKVGDRVVLKDLKEGNIKVDGYEATAKLGSSGITAFEIEEGIEYEDVVTGDLFKLADTGVLLRNTGKGYKQSNLRYKSLKSLRLKEVPKTFPKEGAIYYFVDVTDGEPDVDFHYYRDSYMHNNIIDSVPIFKNIQDAEKFRETLSAFMKQAIKDFSDYTI